MMNWHDTIHIKLQQQQAIHNYRQRHAVTHGNSRMLSYQNRRYINFASNDYLGLSRDVDVIKAWQNGAEYYGLGSGGSGHITGYSSVHKKLEAALADWLGYPQALLFNSGYAANQAAILSFMGAKDRILADKLCHASILEAAKLSPAYLRRFSHNNPASLTQFLTHSKQGFAKSLVITEGVFSMDGDMAPLNTLSSICQKQQSWLMVDDAHGIGAYGEQGRGSCSLYQIKPDLLIITFGKAFGLSGAAILCQNDTAQYLLQCARHLIYSTAMPIAQAYALVTALTKIQQADALREQLADNIGYFRRIGNGLPLSDSKTAIQPIILGDNTRTLRCVERLKTRGIWLTAIRPPTVPHGSARLRITLSAFHTQRDIEQLVEVLDEINNRI